MSTCLWINSACWVIFRAVCYLQSFILTSFKNIFLVSDRVRVHVYIRHNFKQFETLSNFRAWSESRLFANVISGVTTSGDSWSKRPTISKQPLVFYQVARVVSVAMTRENIHYIWKIGKLLSISFPFSSLQEYHFQQWTHNLRVLKTCFHSYTKCIRV